MSVITISNQEEFDSKVLKAAKPVLVDFWAPWCGPCKMVAPEVEAVAQTYEGQAVVAKVNVDEQQQIASQYGVMSIPTLVVLKDGQEINRIVGYRPRKDIGAVIERAL
ncbi:thioredoxin [Lucifera butyrica]|uniref:Thioredoxin n=1 Tax=Lucifera butyrica TaxID=1351585 RepID=A0A498R3T4_9FIRM|nr:thioredoxin [Lucifera butyrica]VBB06064.1 thioredoxin [Lucifera butyrica]